MGADAFLRPRREAEEKAEKVRQQTDFQEKTFSQEGFIDSERQRISESILAQKSDVKNALVEVYAEGFKAVQESAAFKDGGGVAGRAFAEQFRAQVRENFPDVSEDILNTIITAVSLAGQDKITPVAEAGAKAFLDPWQRALKDLDNAGQDFGKALTLAFTDIEAIEKLLEMQKATSAAEEGFKKLADQGLLAALIAEQNLNNSMEAGSAQIEAKIATGQKYLAHLAAQEQTEKEAAAAQKIADDVARTGAELYEERAKSLISSTYPALNAAQRRFVEEKLKEGQATKAAQFAIVAAGGDLSKFADIMAGTGQEASQYADELKKVAEAQDIVGNTARITKDRASDFLSGLVKDLPAATQAQIAFTEATLGPSAAIAEAYAAVGLPLSQIPDFANASTASVKELSDQFKKWQEVADPVARTMQITKDRTQEFLDSVIKGMPAAAQAQIEMVNVAEGPLAALRLAYQQLGIDMSKIPDFANASATSLKELSQAIEAVKVFRETGRLLPASKPKDAVEIHTEAVKAANVDLGKAREDLTEKLRDIDQKFTESILKSSKELSKAQETFDTEIANIDANLAKAETDIDSAIGDVIDKYEQSIRKLDRKEDEIWNEFNRKWEERGDKFVEDRAKIQEDLAKTITDINEQISDAIFKATEAQRKQIADLSASLAKLRAQESDAARSASVTLEDLALRELKATTEEERQNIIRERNRLQAEQGFQQVALQKEITKGQADLHTDLEKAQADLLKQIAELQKQAKEAADNADKELKKLLKDLNKADEDAARELQKQLQELKEARGEAAEARDKQLRELEKRRMEARRQAEEAKAKAQEQLDKAVQQHRENVERARREKIEAEQKAQRDFLEALRKHNEAMRKADEDLQLARDQVFNLIGIKRVAEEQKEILEDIRQIRTPHQIFMNNSNVEEGDVEFIQRAAEEAERLAREPIG